MLEKCLLSLSMTPLCELCVLWLCSTALIISSTKAWAESLDPKGASGVSCLGVPHGPFLLGIVYSPYRSNSNPSQIRFLGDPTAQFTEALDLAFDGTAIFGGPRSKRYALELEDGKVKAMHVEPDNTGLDGNAALFHKFVRLMLISSSLRR
jgi:peroxiredoxin